MCWSVYLYKKGRNKIKFTATHCWGTLKWEIATRKDEIRCYSSLLYPCYVVFSSFQSTNSSNVNLLLYPSQSSHHEQNFFLFWNVHKSSWCANRGVTRSAEKWRKDKSGMIIDNGLYMRRISQLIYWQLMLFSAPR